MDGAPDFHAVDLVYDECSDVQRREEREEVDVEVSLGDGLWHREMNHDETACGEKLRVGLWRRSKKYEGLYCPNCWTPREVLRARIAYEDMLDHRDGNIPQRLDEKGHARLPTITEVIDHQKRRTDRLEARLILEGTKKKDDTK